MDIINVIKDKIYEGNLILVNSSYPLQRREINKLVPVSTDYPNILMCRNTASVLQVILEDISAEQQIVPISGYRSEEEQTEIYNRSLKENGAEFTNKFVALPGHSEHQTGMAIDLGLYSETIDFICPDFPYDGICELFRKTAPHYGFVERYPANKEKITGIAHEPWHFRYVGIPHAEIMTDNDLTLEEYSDFIKEYTPEHPLVYNGIEIYYVPAAGESMEIRLPENALYQLSGNNVDGFIVTICRKCR